MAQNGYTAPNHQNRYYSDGSSIVTFTNVETLRGEHDPLIHKHSPTVRDSSIGREITIGPGAIVVIFSIVAVFLIGLFTMPPGENPVAWKQRSLAFQKDITQWKLEETEWAKARQQYMQDKPEWEKQQASYEQDRMNWESDRDAMNATRIKFEIDFEDWQDQRAKWIIQVEQWEREKRKYEGGYPTPAPGTFWDKPKIAQKCYSYGKREYIARLWNVPGGWSWGDACKALPNEFHGVTFMTPDYCEDLKNSGMWGHWIVSSGEIECKTMLKEFKDLGCVARGSRTKRVEAQITGIREEDDWQLMCGTTPAIIDGVHYLEPSNCEARWSGVKYAIWDIPDYSC